MKLSISNIGWEAKNDIAVYELMKKYGFIGVEIAPTRWISDKPYEHTKEAVEIATKLKEQYGFVISSMQSIWFGKNERIFSSKEEREELLQYTKEAIDYASEIGCKNLVFGCPRNRNIAEEWGLSKETVEEIAVQFFRELGEYALAKGTVVAMEANPPIYNTNYMNTTMEAILLVEKVNSKGFLLNLDVGTMLQNEEAVALLEGKGTLFNHVHISEPGLKIIESRRLHKELYNLLVQEKYDNFVSIEMGKQEDVAKIEEIMKYIVEVFGD